MYGILHFVEDTFQKTASKQLIVKYGSAPWSDISYLLGEFLQY